MTSKKEPIDDVPEETNVQVEQTQPEISDETDNSVVEPDESTSENIEDSGDVPKSPNKFKKLWAKYQSRKKISYPLTIVIILLILAVLPVTRFALAGLIIKKDLSVIVVDKQTNIPISGVELTIRGKTAKTNGEGKASISKVKVGSAKLTANKKYYKDSTQNTVVPLTNPTELKIQLEATGRQVPIHIINKLTGENVANATVKALDTEIQTDKNGEATMVLPPDQPKQSGAVSAEGFNNLDVQITVNQQAVKENTFAITPTGKIYFLSKKSGKIDVVKTDLDGENRQTIVAGTGSEEDTGTVLLASRDWKYLALLSRREGNKARIYLIETENDKLSEIDSGDATFTLVGWQDHFFGYSVRRENLPQWQTKAIALKAFNAETKQLLTLDETTAEGSGDNDYASESLESIYIQKDSLIYVKRWYASYYSVYRLAGKRMGIYSAKLNGTSKQLLKDYDVGNNGYINAVLSGPDEIYFGIYNSVTDFLKYENDKLVEADGLNDDTFNKYYPTYLLSPTGQKTFWYEPRDGKNSLFIGARADETGNEIASLSEYVPYGWFSDKFLLVSKNSSELYIALLSDKLDAGKILKVSDYHKPNFSYLGYGGGYGGQ